MKMDKKEKVKVVLAVSVLFFSVVWGLFLQFVPSAYANGLDTDDPRDDGPEEKELPPCPTEFEDTSCKANGVGEDLNYVDQAAGRALFDCDRKFDICRNSQAEEYLSNKAACEAVEGCQLQSETVSELCYCDWVDDCSSENDPLGPWYCEASGKLDVQGYKCIRVDEEEKEGL
jgi:hypothetical protein